MEGQPLRIHGSGGRGGRWERETDRCPRSGLHARVPIRGTTQTAESDTFHVRFGRPVGVAIRVYRGFGD